MRVDVLPDARNLFDTMTVAADDETTNRFMGNIIFQGGAAVAGGPNAPGYDPDETQSQDGRGPFTLSTYEHDTFMHDQVGLDVDGFPLHHEFPEDYGLAEEDELDTGGEPLFEEELANQAAESKPKRKSKRTKAYKVAEVKLLCDVGGTLSKTPRSVPNKRYRPFGFVSTAFQALEAFKFQHEGKSFNLSHCWRVINEEKKFKVQYAALMATGGKKDEEEFVDGEKTRPRGKTNSKKEDKHDAASNALIATVAGMMNKKDSRDEKRRKDKEDHVNAFMEIQRRRLEMEAEKQAKMFEMEAEKQPRMLEIEDANAKTKAKEVALASMMAEVDIMKVDLNTISPMKRSWYEKI
ncbi:Phospholipid-transporting ATPase 1 [Hordeum vulgare]|nr:Phospholipid-transporting ATPase 1 [Hordeum vulgare]